MVIALCFISMFSAELFAIGSEQTLPMPVAHKVMDVEGWKVHVDRRLLCGDGAELGKRSLRVLSKQLFDITLFVKPEILKRLQAVPIWLDQTCGELKEMQYHPDAGWLKENGYPVELAKCVHIPDASCYIEARVLQQQPWVALHELAHAYHDQVLGFENEAIIAAWKKFVNSGRYESVLHMSGKHVKHYGLTDHKEFFAEMTETYFGMNDYFPFNCVELRREEPEIFELLKRIWGSLP